MKCKCRLFDILFFLLALAIAGCGKKVSESDIAEKTYVYEKEGFGSDFTIEIRKDGTFSYYEGVLSSYLGFGKWELNGDILCLTNDVEFQGNPIVNYFKADGKKLIFISENSSNFTYMDVSDGDKFIRRFGYQKGASHQPSTICGVASKLANTHTCAGFAPKGLLTPES